MIHFANWPIRSMRCPAVQPSVALSLWMNRVSINRRSPVRTGQISTIQFDGSTIGIAGIFEPCQGQLLSLTAPFRFANWFSKCTLPYGLYMKNLANLVIRNCGANMRFRLPKCSDSWASKTANKAEQTRTRCSTGIASSIGLRVHKSFAAVW